MQAPQSKNAIRVIQDDHECIGAVLHGMVFLLRKIAEGAPVPDLKVFRAMLLYIRDYPEKVHHVKEDEFLFARLRMRTHEAYAVLDELEAQHAQGDGLIREVERALSRYEVEGAPALGPLLATAEKYADFYYEHMRMEEDLVLPLARRVLSAEDWSWIDNAFQATRDPLADLDYKGNLDKLFSLIVNIAPPPIGVGPASR